MLLLHLHLSSSFTLGDTLSTSAPYSTNSWIMGTPPSMAQNRARSPPTVAWLGSAPARRRALAHSRRPLESGEGVGVGGDGEAAGGGRGRGCQVPCECASACAKERSEAGRGRRRRRPRRGARVSLRGPRDRPRGGLAARARARARERAHPPARPPHEGKRITPPPPPPPPPPFRRRSTLSHAARPAPAPSVQIRKPFGSPWPAAHAWLPPALLLPPPPATAAHRCAAAMSGVYPSAVR